MAFVLVIQGFDQGVRKDIADSVFKIGRDPSSHLQLNDSEVSRFHAEIRSGDHGAEIHDLGSSNGTFVNGVAQRQAQLRTGDRVLVGKTHLIYTTREPAVSSDVSAEIRLVSDELEQVSRIIKVAPSKITGSSTGQPDSSPAQQEELRRHLQVMYQTTMAVSQTLNIDQLLERLIDLIFGWVEADRACVILLDEKTNEMLPKISRYRSASEEGAGMIISKRILDYVLEHSEGVLTTDACEDERWEAAGSIVGNQIKEAICVPLAGRYGVVGMIYIDTSRTNYGGVMKATEKQFSDEHLKMMVAIAHQAALAIEDTRYYSSMVHTERLAAMGQTITAISHHIKNIIQGVNGGSYLVNEGLASRDFKTLNKGWEIVQRNQNRISDLVLDMLTYSKERRPQVTSSNVNHVVEDVVEILRARAEKEKTELRLASLPGVPQYMFDPDGIHRALLNIASNALDAVQEKDDGRVEILVDHDMTKQLLQIIVTDNGKGIPPDKHEGIFQAFVSGKGGQGTGLGLAVSRKILREHDGNIVIESDGSSGASFRLSWPSVSPTERAERLRDSSVAKQNDLL